MDGFREGQPVWVEQGDGSQRAAIFAGEASSWLGAPPSCYVVYPDTQVGEQVSAIRVIPRAPEEEPA